MENRTLRLSNPLMSGNDVYNLQNKLNSLGYNCGTADGKFGNNTYNAV
jgi:peptidoglycan hydrolase-like protein with peptidoglycan-binding domain